LLLSGCALSPQLSNQYLYQSHQNSDQYYFKQSCKHGSKLGCYRMGYLYANGTEVPKNYKLASKYYSKACQLDSKKGCYSFADLYQKGKGVPKNYKLANTYYKKACKLGNKAGCLNLGLSYAKGQGVVLNDKLSVQYFNKACKLNSAKGCALAGSSYMLGKGVSKNHGLGRQDLSTACQLGNKDSCIILQEMKNFHDSFALKQLNDAIKQLGYKGVYLSNNTIQYFLYKVQSGSININEYRGYWFAFNNDSGVYWKLSQFINNTEFYNARYSGYMTQLTIGIIDKNTDNEPIVGTPLKNADDLLFIGIKNYSSVLGSPIQVLLFKRPSKLLKAKLSKIMSSLMKSKKVQKTMQHEKNRISIQLKKLNRNMIE